MQASPRAGVTRRHCFRCPGSGTQNRLPLLIRAYCCYPCPCKSARGDSPGTGGLQGFHGRVMACRSAKNIRVKHADRTGMGTV